MSESTGTVGTISQWRINGNIYDLKDKNLTEKLNEYATTEYVDNNLPQFNFDDDNDEVKTLTVYTDNSELNTIETDIGTYKCTWNSTTRLYENVISFNKEAICNGVNIYFSLMVAYKINGRPCMYIKQGIVIREKDSDKVICNITNVTNNYLLYVHNLDIVSTNDELIIEVIDKFDYDSSNFHYEKRYYSKCNKLEIGFISINEPLITHNITDVFITINVLNKKTGHVLASTQLRDVWGGSCGERIDLYAELSYYNNTLTQQKSSSLYYFPCTVYLENLSSSNKTVKYYKYNKPNWNNIVSYTIPPYETKVIYLTKLNNAHKINDEILSLHNVSSYTIKL